MESLAVAGGTSMLSMNTIVPAPEGEQDRNLEREETGQGMCRCDCKHVESNAALSTLRDTVGTDTLQEQTGKNLKHYILVPLLPASPLLELLYF